MQTLLLYGRAIARTLATSVGNEIHFHSSPSASSTESLTCNSQPSTNLKLITATCGLGKALRQKESKKTFGDDAYFICQHVRADVIGVADGVGGWRSYGVDPSDFPRNLMATCERLVRSGKFEPNSPAGIISSSYLEILQSKEQLVGSSTACLVSFERSKGQLHTANLGDSGFLLVREGQIVHRSAEQQHYFNTPFQLSVVPTPLEGTVFSDQPESAETTSVDVEMGDVIVVGTDGLFDNMHEDMILAYLSQIKKTSSMQCLQNVANAIVEKAHKLAFDPSYMSPFALHAEINGIDGMKGGKPDDITVILARVSGDT